MIGVVLWCDVAESQAVIWSEGISGLCYFDGLKAGSQSGCSVDVGDVVQFEMLIARNVRMARNVTRLLDNWSGGSGNALDALPREATSGVNADGAEVVPFGYAYSRRRESTDTEPKRKHG